MRCTENIELVLSSATHLPFRDGIFNKVGMFDVLEHLPQQYEKAALMDVCRVLGNYGKFVLSTPNKKLLFTLLDPAFFLMSHRHYCVNDVSQKINEVGFSNVRIFTYGGIREAIFIPIFYLLRKLKLCDYKMPSIFLRRINEEYAFPRDGGYTIFVECTGGTFLGDTTSIPKRPNHRRVYHSNILHSMKDVFSGG
jgi:SAM-dependent methyltransferase